MVSEYSDDHEDVDDESALARLVELGIDAIGATAGGVVGLAVGGPPGAIFSGTAGVAATHGLQTVAGDFIRRRLSRREMRRTGTVFALTTAAIQREVRAGRRLRTDGFFNAGTPGPGRSSAEEVAEAVILAAQRDPMERKLRHYSELLASIAVVEAIDEATAQRLVALLRDLSWRQLEMLALFSVADDDELVIHQSEFPDLSAGTSWIRTSGIVADLGDLFTRGLANGSWGASAAQVRPRRLSPKGLGTFLVWHARLGWIDRAELSSLRERMLLAGHEESPYE